MAITQELNEDHAHGLKYQKIEKYAILGDINLNFLLTAVIQGHWDLNLYQSGYSRFTCE